MEDNTLHSDFWFVGPAGTPQNEWKHCEKQNKTQDKEKNITPPRPALLIIKIVIWAFLFYDTALVPALLVFAMASILWLNFPGARLQWPRKPASGRLSGMAPKRWIWMRGWPHGAENGGGLKWHLLSIMRIPGRTLYIVYRPSRWPGWGWRCQTGHLWVWFCMHFRLSSQAHKPLLYACSIR